jgi:3-mercaptopyruvate sulfurtransferase SseA
MARFISIEDLAGSIDRENNVVVDVRPMAAFNGWRLRQESRGGHMAGAVPFPLSWMDLLDPAVMVEFLQNRGILPGKNVILYGYGHDDGEAAATKLAGLGFHSLQVFRDGLPAWALDAARPMNRLSRYKHLVYPEWLASLITDGAAPEYDGGSYVLAHTSFDNHDDYDAGHIPGAISLDTLFLEEPEHWNRRNPDELEQALLANGITRDTTVVLYGRNSNPTMTQEHPGRHAGEIAAMRTALLLLYAGVLDVRVLDGGLNAWIREGRETTTQPVSPVPVEEFGCRIPARPDYIIDIEEAKDYLADSQSELVCMRSWPEFLGEKSGYHYIGPRGRIPGAVFGNCGSDAYHMENYRNHDNTMLCYHEIEANWKEIGIVPGKRIAFYCGTGWRASEAFFYAYLLGWNRIAVYDGGWYEWSIDEGNPTETGPPSGPVIRTRRY